MKTTKMLIDGQLLAAADGQVFQSVNPATGKKICDVSLASEKDADAAIAAARRAFDDGPWRRMDATERGKKLRRVADIIRERQSELAELDCSDCGKPLADSTGVDVPVAAEFFEYFAGMCDKICGQTVPAGNDFLNYTIREPMGVVGQITPWNFPILNAAIKLAPALACGNTIVLKPAQLTSLSAVELGRICLEADIPPGVVNVIPGKGSVAGEALLVDPRVNKISFTGSTDVGRHIMKMAAGTLKPVTLELGGKGPCIVFEDANIEEAVAGALFGVFLNQGQVCCAGTRLFLADSIYDSFMECLLHTAGSIKVGDPTCADNQMGAIVSAGQLETVQSYVKVAQDEGAKLVLGGNKPDLPAPFDKGNFYNPTIFTEVENNMRIAQEEVFGPVLSVLRFKSEQEVVAMANDTIFGLAAGVWTNDLRRAHRMAAQLQAGVIWLNTSTHFSWAAPYGGIKQSGFGREMGWDIVNIYTHSKNVWVNLNDTPNPWAKG